jgi:hypothetical protein
LRKALCLTKVLSAEELKNAPSYEPGAFDARIASSMLMGLKKMAERVKVDLHKVALKLGFQINAVEELTKDQGLQISEAIGNYLRNPKDVPNEVR